MISKRDSKPFCVKFAIGVLDSTKTNMVYEDDWQIVYGLRSDPSGSKTRYIYGNEEHFDEIVTVNASSMTRRIKDNTLVCLDNYPTTTFSGGDYYIKYIFPEYNGEIVIGLKKIESIDIPKLYFLYGDNILYYQLNFDKKTNKGYISKDEIPPFKLGDYVWTRQPSDKTMTKHRLKYSDSSKIGVASNFTNFLELTFVED